MYSEIDTQAALYRLYQATGTMYKVERNEAMGMAYIMSENGMNVLVRVPDYSVVSVIDFAQRTASRAVARANATNYDAG